MGTLDHEFTAGGVFLYLAGFLFLVLPPIIWGLESLKAKWSEPQTPQSRLPKPSKTLPMPPTTKITQIRVHPIKSCRGFKVDKAWKLLQTGLDLDRHWMFVDPSSNNKFLTIRQIPEMTLINTRVSENDELIMWIRNQEPNIEVKIPAHPTEEWLKANTKLCDGNIWGQITDAWMYSAELTKPFADFLKRDIRLVYKGPTPRPLRGNGAAEILGRKASTNFADLMPLLIGNEKSMEDINHQLKAKGEDSIIIERFRPNIVVDGESPWYEDVWLTVKIGSEEKSSVTIDVPARCARCQVPNVDPETGVKHKKQPWDTLMGYRRIDEGIKFKPCFGMLAVPREEGEVHVGQEFHILEVTEDHKYIKGISLTFALREALVPR